MSTKVIHIKDAPPGWKTSTNYVYIGRGSTWGNPFIIGARHPQSRLPMNREEVCDLYDRYTLPRHTEHVHELKGKTLVCFCKSRPNIRCHGDSLAKAADKKGNES